MKYAALITGATNGLGTELAKLHAARKKDILFLQDAINNAGYGGRG